MVPVPDYHESKMKLAAQGLPTSVPAGTLVGKPWAANFILDSW